MEKVSLPFHFLSHSPFGNFLGILAGKYFLLFDRRKLKLLSQSNFENGQNHSATIRNIIFNSDESLFVTVGDDKQVKLWDLTNLKCLGSYTLAKKITAVTFAPAPKGNSSEDLVIVADKFGETFSASLSSFSFSPDNKMNSTLLGHVSTITSLLFSPSNAFLLSSDRDEKIRVSHYPDVYNIETYCLGHTSFVSSILIPSNKPNLLFSGGGDGTIKVWDYVKGNLLHSYKLEKANHSSTLIVSSMTYSSFYGILAILVEDDSEIYFFQLSFDKDSLNSLPSLKLESKFVSHLAFDLNGELWIVGRDPFVQVFTFDKVKQTFFLNTTSQCLPLIELINTSTIQVEQKEYEQFFESLLPSDRFRKYLNYIAPHSSEKSKKPKLE